jgi:hypothetical protein
MEHRACLYERRLSRRRWGAQVTRLGGAPCSATYLGLALAMLGLLTLLICANVELGK